MKTAAVLPALGIGDALLMMIASHQLQRSGYHVTTFHEQLPELGRWFPGHTFALPQESFLSSLSSFDLVVVENDNSPKIQSLISHLRPVLSLFYPTYSPKKHPPLAPNDFVFNPDIPMAENIAIATAGLLGLPRLSKDNGLTPPSHLIHRKNETQVLIHPTSRVAEKNWLASSFVSVATRLKKRGFSPIFCVGPNERAEWEFIQSKGFVLADLLHLEALAELAYESGSIIGNDSLAGHLGSNLNLLTLIVANDEKRMRLWRPGWRRGEVVFPPRWLPNGKFLRLRENHWQHFVSVNKVLTRFEKLLRMP